METSVESRFEIGIVQNFQFLVQSDKFGVQRGWLLTVLAFNFHNHLQAWNSKQLPRRSLGAHFRNFVETMSVQSTDANSSSESLKKTSASNKQRIPICQNRYAEALEKLDVPLTDAEFARVAGVSWNTLQKVRKGKQVDEGSVQRILKALKLKRSDLELNLDQEEESHFLFPPPSGWKVLEVINPMTETSNGVHYVIAKLQNTLFPDKLARGKLYDLSHVKAAERIERHKYLLRHVEVCEKIDRNGADPKKQLALNFDLKQFKTDCAWWILDRWINGTTLSDLVPDEGAPWPIEVIASIGSGILEALDILHELKVIMRELTPDRIIVDGSQVTLTDFEIAKLIGSSISVRGDWFDSCPYRAPEVSSSNELKRSDIFSWGTTMRFIFNGSPDKKDKRPNLPLDGYPEIKKFLNKCSNPIPKNRPSDAKVALEHWKLITSEVSS